MDKVNIALATKKIETLLKKALVQNGKLAQALYDYELVEHIDYWYDGLKRDHDKFVFAVTENSGDVAMVFITKDKTIYVNEEARAKLMSEWPNTYATNIKRLIPMMATQLANDILSVNGVKVVRS